jgi:carboxyl-terminal processing protease
LIVGDESTFGKGTVQTVIPLAKFMDRNGMAHSFDPGALKVTIQKFYRPSGASTQFKGVKADIALPSLSDVADVGESKLQYPLPWDLVPPADFVREDHITRFLKELRARSAARVAGEKGFTYLREDIAQFKKNLATKTVSLNETERRRENQADQNRDELRKQELLALGERQPATYDITVKNADASGLPAPEATQGNAPMAKSASAADKKALAVEISPALGDPDLRETEHIMADYVNLLHQTPAVALAAP